MTPKEWRRQIALAIIASGNYDLPKHGRDGFAQHVWKLADAILKAESEPERAEG